MKKALVCIAKNEDLYIDEWLEYHLAIGFDDIFVYQNNWRYAGDKSRWQSVHWIEFDGDCKQLAAYNDWLLTKADGFSWAAFFDIDEFLCLKEDKSLDSFLKRYERFCGVAVNWRCFGDNGLKFDGYSSVLERFTKCQIKLDRHVKTIAHVDQFQKGMFLFSNPHFFGAASLGLVVDITGNKQVRGPWNEDCQVGIAQLNHYHCKTKQEWEKKMERGRPDVPNTSPLYHYSEAEFNKHNFNEVDDFAARDFMRSTKSKNRVSNICHDNYTIEKNTSARTDS